LTNEQLLASDAVATPEVVQRSWAAHGDLMSSLG